MLWLGNVPSLGFYVNFVNLAPNPTVSLINLVTARAKWNCLTADESTGVTCTYGNNKRRIYLMYTSGLLVLAMSIARITILQLKETLEYFPRKGKDTLTVDGCR